MKITSHAGVSGNKINVAPHWNYKPPATLPHISASSECLATNEGMLDKFTTETVTVNDGY